MKTKPLSRLSKHLPEFIVFCFCLLLAWWLMWHTLNFSSNQVQIAGKIWSDFASHLPLIRSFSFGPNLSQFPPQFPLFPGPPIRYHFLFYLLVALLEKVGLPLVWALNLLSITGFTLLTFLIYILGKTLFKSRLTGLISLLLFLFNSSTSWYYFFTKHGWTPDNINLIFTNAEFPAFAPYDGGVVTGGFWNLNVFTNQRHFALALTLPLLLLLLLPLRKKNSLRLALLTGTLIGLLPFLHGAVFIMTLAFVATLFLITPLKRTLFVTGLTASVLALPQFLLIQPSIPTTSSLPFEFFPGYLAAVPHLTPESFLKFWSLNLGLTLITLPLGFLLAPRTLRKYFLPFLAVFAIGNLFKFSPDISVNHKFFNLFIIGANFYSAYFLSRLIHSPHLPLKFLAFPLLFFLTFSGFIDFWPIKNDNRYSLEAWQDNPTATWIYHHTAKNAVFLNNTFLYHPASLVGRSVYMGWPYFAWSAGYNTYARDNQMKTWFKPLSQTNLCHDLQAAGINFIALNHQHPDYPTNFGFFAANFHLAFTSPDQKWKIYNVSASCLPRRSSTNSEAKAGLPTVVSTKVGLPTEASAKASPPLKIKN